MWAHLTFLLVVAAVATAQCPALTFEFFQGSKSQDQASSSDNSGYSPLIQGEDSMVLADSLFQHNHVAIKITFLNTSANHKFQNMRNLFRFEEVREGIDGVQEPTTFSTVVAQSVSCKAIEDANSSITANPEETTTTTSPPSPSVGTNMQPVPVSTNSTSMSSSSSIIFCKFSISPNYVLRSPERVAVIAESPNETIVGQNCAIGAGEPNENVVVGSFLIVPSSTDLTVASFKVLSAVATGLASAVVLSLADGTPIEMQAMSVMMDSACGSNTDKESVSFVRYFVSPFADLGPFWIMTGNVLMCALAFTIHLASTILLDAWRKHKKEEEEKENVNNKKRKSSSSHLSARSLSNRHHRRGSSSSLHSSRSRKRSASTAPAACCVDTSNEEKEDQLNDTTCTSWERENATADTATSNNNISTEGKSKVEPPGDTYGVKDEVGRGKTSPTNSTSSRSPPSTTTPRVPPSPFINLERHRHRRRSTVTILTTMEDPPRQRSASTSPTSPRQEEEEMMMIAAEGGENRHLLAKLTLPQAASPALGHSCNPVLTTPIATGRTTSRTRAATNMATTSPLPPAQVTMKFPGATMALNQLLYMGVASGTFSIFSQAYYPSGSSSLGYSSTPTTGHIVAAYIVGLGFLITIPVSGLLLMSRAEVGYVLYDKIGVSPFKNTTGNDDILMSGDEKIIEEEKEKELSPIFALWRKPQWLYPKGIWVPEKEVAPYTGLIGPLKSGFRLAVFVLFAFPIIVAVLMSALPGVEPCEYLYVGIATSSIVFGMTLLTGNPLRSFPQTVLTCVCFVLVGVLAILQIIALQGNSHAIEAAKSAFNFILVFSVALRAVHNIFVFYVEFTSLKPQLRSMTCIVKNRNDEELYRIQPDGTRRHLTLNTTTVEQDPGNNDVGATNTYTVVVDVICGVYTSQFDAIRRYQLASEEYDDDDLSSYYSSQSSVSRDGGTKRRRSFEDTTPSLAADGEESDSEEILMATVQTSTLSVSAASSGVGEGGGGGGGGQFSLNSTRGNRHTNTKRGGGVDLHTGGGITKQMADDLSAASISAASSEDRHHYHQRSISSSHNNNKGYSNSNNYGGGGRSPSFQISTSTSSTNHNEMDFDACLFSISSGIPAAYSHQQPTATTQQQQYSISATTRRASSTASTSLLFGVVSSNNNYAAANRGGGSSSAGGGVGIESSLSSPSICFVPSAASQQRHQRHNQSGADERRISSSITTTSTSTSTEVAAIATCTTSELLAARSSSSAEVESSSLLPTMTTAMMVSASSPSIPPPPLFLGNNNTD